MTIPAFWATPFSYTELIGVTDVATIVTGLDTALRAMGWTDVGGTHVGPWTSPARADGILLKVSVSKVSATRLSWITYDQQGMNMMNANVSFLQDIDIAGSNVQIYAGTLHMAVNTQRATPEPFWVCVLDQSPDLMNLPRPMYICYTGPRTNDGTLRNYPWGSANMMQMGATSYSARSSMNVVRAPSGNYTRRTVAGTALFNPAEYCDNAQTPPLFMGRIPQAIAIDSTGLRSCQKFAY